jgi:hypothetical protein
VHDAAELEAALDALDPDELASGGIVLEEQLTESTMWSVGQVRVGELLARGQSDAVLDFDAIGVDDDILTRG